MLRAKDQETKSLIYDEYVGAEHLTDENYEEAKENKALMKWMREIRIKKKASGGKLTVPGKEFERDRLVLFSFHNNYRKH